MAISNLQTLELFSTVALLRDLPEKGLVRGQVGAVVEVFSPEHVLVEFGDPDGGTYAMETLHKDDLMRLHHRSLDEIVSGLS
ncbi:MAG: DUF4926 domain-containing protein [Acidobacteriota bacterium]